MSYFTIYVLFYLFLFYLFFKKKFLGISFLFFFTAFNYLTSLYFIEEDDYISFLIHSLNCNAIILIGYFFFKKNYLVSIENSFKKNIYSINKIILIFFIISFYHYFVTGIPFLSENIDKSRFTRIASGLFGIPSRVSFYGVIILFLLTIFSFEYKFFSKKKIFLFSMLIFLLVVFQSNKSSVLQIIYYFMIVYPFINLQKKNIYNFKNYIILFTLTIIYFLFIFGELRSIDNIYIFEYLKSRSTTISFDPGLYLINLKSDNFELMLNYSILNDIFYPIFKLFGFDVQTVVSQLSLKMFGIREDNFILPITPHWFGYHYFIFKNSIIITYFYSFLFGIFIAKLDNIAFATNSVFTRISIITFLYFIWNGYQKGNLYYIILNVLIVIGLYYFIGTFFKNKNINMLEKNY